MNLAYLIPEFPGQTHVWMWREIVHLRQWGLPIAIFSTRQPPPRDLARHAFAKAAQDETTYLGASKTAALAAVVWALFTRPLGLLRCIKLALTLPVESRPNWRGVLPLVAPACLLARHIRQRNIDHLHCHTCANGAILAMMNRRLTGVPYSLTLNANLEWWGGAMAQKLGEAKFTIAIADWLLQQIRRDYPQMPENQSLLGRIGVDTHKWKPSEGNGHDANGTARIVSVGRLTESKGFDLLLRAVQQLKQGLRGGKKLSVRIIGAGPQGAELEKLTRNLGLDDCVKFLGSMSEDQIIEELRSADLFVLASHAEPLGVVYMEAMSMSVATIGTAAGGVGEIITDGQNGLLAPPMKVDPLAQRMNQLMGNPDERRRLAAAGRQTIVQKFDSRLGAAVLYERLTGKKPPSDV